MHCSRHFESWPSLRKETLPCLPNKQQSCFDAKLSCFLFYLSEYANVSTTTNSTCLNARKNSGTYIICYTCTIIISVLKLENFKNKNISWARGRRRLSIWICRLVCVCVSSKTRLFTVLLLENLHEIALYLSNTCIANDNKWE